MRRHPQLRRAVILAALPAWLAIPSIGSVRAADDGATVTVSDKDAKPKQASFTAQQSVSDGSVIVRGQKIDYQAVAGTLVIHPKGWDDSNPDQMPGGKDASECWRFKGFERKEEGQFQEAHR